MPDEYEEKAQALGLRDQDEEPEAEELGRHIPAEPAEAVDDLQNTPDEPEDTAAKNKKRAVQVSTKIKYDATAEDYVAGKCTVTLALTIFPDDGHPDGRRVIIGVKSHNEAPLFCDERLHPLSLPASIANLMAQYGASLPARGVKVAEAKAKADAEKKAKAEKLAKDEAERKANRPASHKKSKQKAKSKPTAKPTAPLF